MASREPACAITQHQEQPQVLRDDPGRPAELGGHRCGVEHEPAHSASPHEGRRACAGEIGAGPRPPSSMGTGSRPPAIHAALDLAPSTAHSPEASTRPVAATTATSMSAAARARSGRRSPAREAGRSAGSAAARAVSPSRTERRVDAYVCGSHEGTTRGSSAVQIVRAAAPSPCTARPRAAGPPRHPRPSRVRSKPRGAPVEHMFETLWGFRTRAQDPGHRLCARGPRAPARRARAPRRHGLDRPGGAGRRPPAGPPARPPRDGAPRPASAPQAPPPTRDHPPETTDTLTTHRPRTGAGPQMRATPSARAARATAAATSTPTRRSKTLGTM